MPDLLFASEGHLATITINRPGAVNAMRHDMWVEMLEMVRHVEHDANIRCLVITGAGENFCAGGDVKEFATMTDAPASERAEHFMREAERANQLLVTLERIPQPVIASARGAVAGGGLGLVAAADLAIASVTARFFPAQIRLGAMPDFGVGYNMLRSVGLKRAKQYAMLGETIDAKTASALGLVNWVVPDDALEDRTLEVATSLIATSPVAVTLTKHQLNRAHLVPLSEHLAGEARDVGTCVSGEDFVANVRAFIEMLTRGH